jgi:MoxR-like ATPase
MGLASGLSLAATGLTGASYFLKGREAASSARAQGQSAGFSRFYDAMQAQLAAQAGELKATETDTFLRRRTEGALANIDAVLAGTGTVDSSPSSWAVKNRFEALADEARTTATSNIRRQAQADRNAAQLYALSGMNAINAANQNASQLDVTGLLFAGGSLFKRLPNFGEG